MPPDDNTPSQGTPAPTPPAAPAPAPGPTPTATPTIDEAAVAKFLAPRLEKAKQTARQAALMELGIEDGDLDKAKAIIAAGKKAEDEAKTVAEKLGETNQTLAQIRAENERLTKFNEERAERLSIGLTEEQRTYVEGAIKAAGGDPKSPLARLAMIEHMVPQWAAAKGAENTPPKDNGAKPPATPSTGTAPAANAPPENNQSPPNHRDTFAALASANPFTAARYGLQHLNDVFPDKTD